MARNAAFEGPLLLSGHASPLRREVTVPCRSHSAIAQVTRARVRNPCVLLAALIPGSVALAQQPPTAPAAAYHPPLIVLTAPLAGSSIPADKPVIVLRFTAGEPTDGIDPSSLRVSVDGEDRTSLLQLGIGEAWGSLARDGGSSAPPGVVSAAASPIAPGVHLLHVRLCSMRGVCSTLDAPVTVTPSETSPTGVRTTTPTDSSAQQRSHDSKLHKALDFLIAGARKLLAP